MKILAEIHELSESWQNSPDTPVWPEVLARPCCCANWRRCHLQTRFLKGDDEFHRRERIPANVAVRVAGCEVLCQIFI